MASIVIEKRDGTNYTIDLRDHKTLRLYYNLSENVLEPEERKGRADRKGGISIVSTRAGARQQSVLIASTETLVNGVPPVAGLRLLRDNDHISHRGGRMQFLARSAARLTPFPSEASNTRCPACGDRIEEGTTAVECPGCAVWHHQTPERPCWSSLGECATRGCGEKTDLVQRRSANHETSAKEAI